MIRTATVIGALASLLSVGAAGSGPDLTVATDTAAVSTESGATVALGVTITNSGSAPSGPLVAHLVVVDPTGDGSADAEDWTDQLTRHIGSVDPGTSAELDWDIKPIKAGTYFVMIAVAPLDATGTAVSGPVVFDVSPPGGLTVGSVVVVSSMVPVALLLGEVVVRRRERRRQTAIDHTALAATG